MALPFHIQQPGQLVAAGQRIWYNGCIKDGIKSGQPARTAERGICMETILLHGLGQTADSFSLTARWMGMGGRKWGGARCPALGSLMRGEAAYPVLYRGFSDYCAGFEGPLALAGLSLGGILALDYTIQNPGRVGALVLIAAPYKMPKKMLAVQDFLFRLMPKGAFKGMGFSKEEVRSLTRSMKDLDFTGRLLSVEAPVLLVCGGKDKQNMPSMEALQKHLPEADLVIFEHAGHEVNVDEPERLGDLLIEFFEKAEQAD